MSSTPGKTKHFQTIHLSESIVLCDCPGLVFPQFATTKAALVCDAVLPIDQMREYTGPTSLLVQRIPREVIETVYGLTIKVKGVDEGGDGKVTAENFLISYAGAFVLLWHPVYAFIPFLVARGFTRAGQGNPDEARAARVVLKDYVTGKLLFSHAPPGISDAEFNEETHRIALRRAAGKKRAPVTRVGKNADTFVTSAPLPGGAPGGAKTNALDSTFFQENSNSSLASHAYAKSGALPSRSKLFPHQNVLTNDATPLNLRQARIASVLANQGVTGKKHHKKMKKVKQRSGKGYDLD